jgi:hypothetical protein
MAFPGWGATQGLLGARDSLNSVFNSVSHFNKSRTISELCFLYFRLLDVNEVLIYQNQKKKKKVQTFLSNCLYPP